MGYRFNTPPNWPAPASPDWLPPKGWKADASWGPAPDGWNFWVEDPTFAGQPSVAGAVAAPAVARKNWFLRHKVITMAGAVLLLVTFAGIVGGGGNKSVNVAPVGDPVVTSATPDQAAIDKAAADKAASDKAAGQAAADKAAADKAASDKAAADQAAADKVAADKAAAAKPATPAPEVFKMPNLVGENLQLAQDKLQALGSYLMDQQDAAGLGRIQVLDSNWQVCTQDPAPGATVPVDTMVTLAAVKLAEHCP
jgi:PASTA domain